MIIFLPLWSCVACAAGKAVNVKLTVVDDNKIPVAEAKVGMGFLLSHGGNSFRGNTDADGYVEATENGIFGVRISINKNNYYETDFRTGYGDQELTLVLREKKNPIAMYAKKILVNARDARKNGEQFGYDFVVGDYVYPIGKGIVSDLLITHTYTKTDYWTYDFNIDISFSNPEDGLIPFFIKHAASDFGSNYSAPESGYINHFSIYGNKKGEGQPVTGNKDKKRNYYFRVRTATDDKGEIISAHYGKIYGEFTEIIYYINPTPNDRNVEYNVQRNLFKNSADRGEWVSKP